MIVTTDDPSHANPPDVHPDPAQAHLGQGQTYKTIGEAEVRRRRRRRHRARTRLAEWKTGQFVRFVRNPNYWGPQGAADEVVIQFFKNADTMVQALKAGELDYARGVNADQFNAAQDRAGHQDGRRALRTAGPSSAFNTYGTGTGKTIKGGGPSTKALLDPAFRDALGYAVDKQTLVDRVLGGYGDGRHDERPAGAQASGTSSPTTVRTFDIDARQAEARRGRLPPRCLRQSARQGGQADQPPAVHAGLRRHLSARSPSSSRTGAASSGSR